MADQIRLNRLLLVIAAIGLVALVIFAKIPQSSQFHLVLHKTGHPLAFGLLAVIVARLIEPAATRRTFSPTTTFALAFAGAVALGAATELAQTLVHRGASLLDILRDAVGALAGLSILALVDKSYGRRAAGNHRRTAVMALAFAASLVAVAPLVWCIAAYANRDLRFPVLAAFDSPLDLYFLDRSNPLVRMDLPEAWARLPREKALLIDFDAGRYRGAGLIEPYPDWQGYEELAVDLTNPMDVELEVIIRVHDRHHDWRHEDRFNGLVRLSSRSRKVVRIPMRIIENAPRGRRMDLRRIAGIVVFAPRAGPSDGQFFLNRVWLERTQPEAARL